MDLFLVKLGKAFEAIKRDGLIVGGKRVLQYLGTFLKAMVNFSSGDVLFITGGVGDSARYRCYHVAEELNLHGMKASVTIQDNPFLPMFADKFKIFIFHRVLFTAGVEKLVNNIKKQNKEIIFETDDLVFDTKYMHATDSYAKMNSLEKKQYKKGVGEEILKDDYVKICTTTTAYLADILRTYGKKVFIVPNKLSKHDLEMADEILKGKSDYQRTVLKGAKEISEDSPRHSVRIGYFSGTMSHNRDFATITEPLTRIMEKYSNVELVLAGPLEVEDRLNKFKNRIRKTPFVPRKENFENMSVVDINIAPLEMDNPFCEAKSEIRFFAAGIVGVPTVAVANQTFREAIEDGVDGFLAGTTEEWVEKLSKLIENRELRAEMGKKAREKALQKYSNKNSHNEAYYNYLKNTMIPNVPKTKF